LHAGPERGGQLDFAIGSVAADRFGSVLDEIEEHLDELIAVGKYRGQRRIVFLDEFDLPAEAGLYMPSPVRRSTQ